RRCARSARSPTSTARSSASTAIRPGCRSASMPARPLRILVAKPGLDGHDRGVKIIARALRDAGFEVIYTGLHQTPEMIAEAAGPVGLASPPGAHLTLSPAVIDELRQRGGGDIAVFGGGIIPEDDRPALRAAGVSEIFTPGATTQEIVAWIRDSVRARTS